jgi:hypothetical protein
MTVGSVSSIPGQSYALSVLREREQSRRGAILARKVARRTGAICLCGFMRIYVAEYPSESSFGHSHSRYKLLKLHKSGQKRAWSAGVLFRRREGEIDPTLSFTNYRDDRRLPIVGRLGNDLTLRSTL